MTFDWDPAKSEQNFVERGFDFAFAAQFFAGAYVEFDDTRRDYGERRVIALGVADGIPLTVVFTDRVAARAALYVGSSVRVSVIARSVVGMPKASKPPVRPTTARNVVVRATAPTQGRADLARLRRTTDAEIAQTSPAELRDLPDDFWQGARVVTPVAKEAISIRLDEDVLAWFRASGPRYQSRINAVLRSYVAQVAEPARPAKRKRAI